MSEYQVLSDGAPDGCMISSAAAEKTGDHGVVSAQIANIAIVSGSYTTTGATQLADLQNTAINAIIAALTNKGLVAAS